MASFAPFEKRSSDKKPGSVRVAGRPVSRAAKFQANRYANDLGSRDAAGLTTASVVTSTAASSNKTGPMSLRRLDGPSPATSDRPGVLLSQAIRSDMERAFGGRDFGGVRIQQDGSAKALGAVAYAHREQIVFQPGRYAPQTPAGLRVLAHELAHVVQQRSGPSEPRVSRPGEPAEREAHAAAGAALTGATPRFRGGGVPAFAALSEDGSDEIHQPIVDDFRSQQGLDKTTGPSDAEIKYEILPAMVAQERAQRIIDMAADQTVPIGNRAVAVVHAILDTYYPAQNELVADVVFDAGDAGLTTKAVDGPTARGTIHVGTFFVTHTTSDAIARRVLQVGHELEHVRQHRRGMGGPARADEREFLAFHLEATSPEAPGTGRMNRAMRVTLIDVALGYYYCLSADLQQKYRSKFDELVARRASEQSGHRPTPVPTTCKRP